MYSCIDLKSRKNIEERFDFKELCKYNTSTELSSSTDHSPKKLLSVFDSILCGSLDPKQLFSQPNLRPAIKRQTSIQNLQILVNQPVQGMRTSISAFSQRFSAFNLDRSSCFNSLLSAHMDQPQTSFKDFDIDCTLSQSDIQYLFCNGDMKIMVAATALMCKYLVVSGHPLSRANLFAIFATSAIVMFKMSYDQELPGLMKEFSLRMGVNSLKLEKFQSFFLKALDYDLNLPGKATAAIMAWFI